MSLSKTILDVRNMQRSVALRNELDPAKVVEVLEQILKDSVVSTASNSRAFQKKAYEELTNIRRDLAAGQINAGVATGPMTGIFSHMIDQMDGMQEENKASNKGFNSALDHLTKSIPSADTFIAALMTANPLLGYGVKVARDIGRSTKTLAANRKQENKKKETLLVQQEKFLQEQLKLLAVEEKAVGQQLTNETSEAKQKRRARGGVYQEILNKIHEELEILRKEWTGEAKQGELIEGEYKIIEGIENNSKESIERIEDLNKTVLEQTEQEKENSVNEMEHEKELERLRGRDDKLEQLKDSPNIPAPNLKPLEKTLDDKKSGFSKLLDGMLAPIMAIARGAVIGFGLAAVSLIGTMVAIPTLIATAIYKFLDGFFNAEEIIGKSAEDITMLDRVKAGAANIWGTALRILDWVAEALGLDFFDSEDMEKRIYKFLDNGEKKIVQVYNNAINYLVEKYESIIKSVTGFFDKVQEFFDNIMEFFTKKYTDFMGVFDKLSVGGIWDTINPFSSPETGEVDAETKIEQLEEQKKFETQKPNGRNFGSSMGEAERNSQSNAQPLPPTIIAPNTNNNTTNNNTYGGPPTTFNHDPDFRASQGRNKKFSM